jgi:simple sugar transport system ATP-binding protein
VSVAPVVEMTSISKEYRGVPALRDVGITLNPGEIHAVLGENGAGKSTLMKIMAGVVARSAGTMRLDGREVTFNSPAEALDGGVVMVFQETSLVPSMSVAQNIYLGDEKLFNRLRGLYIAAQQFLQSLNFSVDPWAMVSTLGAAKKQMVEIARAVRHNAKVIIFDEPTASLTPEEKGHFFSLLQRLKKSGVSIVFISHALEEALSVSDRITILRDGELVSSGPTSSYDRDSIIRAMVGRALSNELYSKGQRTLRPAGERILSVQNLSMGAMVRNNSFSIYAGQVTGVFGLIGSGRTETAKVIAGVQKRNYFHGGEVKYRDAYVSYRVPRPAVRDGIVYVTEDRKLEGFFETMSISENIYSSLLASGLKTSSIVRGKDAREIAADWTRKLNIRAINGDTRVIELSGGNQQKVVIASGLVQEPKLVIFDEPTRGVDVGAIAEIHEIIGGLADSGLAVLVISSYLPEIMNISDRILISRLGRIVEEFTPGETTEEQIMYASVH